MGIRTHFLPFPSILHGQAKVVPVNLTEVCIEAALVGEQVDAIEG